MEPVSIIGLVASLLQLAQFSTTILSKAKEIHHSTRAATKDNVVIEDIVLHLKESLSRIDGFPTSRSEHITELRTQCDQIANEILKALDDVKVKEPSSKWKSVRKAVKAVRSRGKLEEWMKRLQAMRDEYNIEIELELLCSIDLLKLQQTQVFHDLGGTQKVMSQTLVSALQADRDASDAMAAQHDNIRTLTLLEFEATRLHSTSEARTTRRLVVESSTQAGERSDANHEETRELVSSQTNDIVAHIVQSRQQLEAHIDNTAQIQTHQVQRDIAQSQVNSQIVLESRVRKLQEDAASELDIANFVTDWQIKSITEDAIENLGAQLSRTQLELRELQLAQVRQRIEHSCKAHHASLERKKETPVGPTAGTAHSSHSTASEAMTSYKTRLSSTDISRRGPGAPSLEQVPAYKHEPPEQSSAGGGTGYWQSNSKHERAKLSPAVKGRPGESIPPWHIAAGVGPLSYDYSPPRANALHEKDAMFDLKNVGIFSERS